MGPGLAWPESQDVVQPLQANGVREREAAADNLRLKRRPSAESISIDDAKMALPGDHQSTPAPNVPVARKVPGKDALSFAVVLRTRNKIAGMNHG